MLFNIIVSGYVIYLGGNGGSMTGSLIQIQADSFLVGVVG